MSTPCETATTRTPANSRRSYRFSASANRRVSRDEVINQNAIELACALSYCREKSLQALSHRAGTADSFIDVDVPVQDFPIPRAAYSRHFRI